MQHVLNASEYETVFYVVLIQSGFYIAYIFNCVFDGTIYGRGKTQYMLIESIATNGKSKSKRAAEMTTLFPPIAGPLVIVKLRPASIPMTPNSG